MCMTPKRPTPDISISTPSAFTLVEIALAIGIFAFTIVAIMALLPVGLHSANESRVQSIVTLIAHTVLGDLRTGELKKARILLAPLPADGSAPAAASIREFDLSLDPPVPAYLLYGHDGCVIREIAGADAYNDPAPEGGFVIKVESKLVSSTTPLLAQVTVTIESPAAATSANRTKYPVVTLMGDTR